MVLRWLVFSLLVLLAASASARVASYEGRVLRVVDGDTLVLRSSYQVVRIRLAEIDAPEHDQPYGTEARNALANMVNGRMIRIVAIGHDRYGRVVARLYADGLDVNAALVEEGSAWVYPQYAHDPNLYTAQREARNAGRGLWAQENPIPPWEWRRRQHGYFR